MIRYVPSCELVESAALGKTQAISRLISRAEAGVPEVRQALAMIYQRAGRHMSLDLPGCQEAASRP